MDELRQASTHFGHEFRARFALADEPDVLAMPLDREAAETVGEAVGRDELPDGAVDRGDWRIGVPGLLAQPFSAHQPLGVRLGQGIKEALRGVAASYDDGGGAGLVEDGDD
ncbi:hypothetical protein [Streptomyces sp. C10-9-1]|uniref:hypothetical protein n=1 Tax=Streptomyces sp. C10-9-1 TaxID=1859285 RepID=UPI003F4A748C